MGRLSIKSKSFKEYYQNKIDKKELAAQKLKEEQKKEFKKQQIEEAAKSYKYNWREEIKLQESSWSAILGSGPTNSASQSFSYSTPNFETGQPNTVTVSGLGGFESVPSTVTVDFGFGETENVSGPNYNQLGMQGYAPLLQMQKRGNQTEDERIDAEIRKLEEQIKQLEQKISDLGEEQITTEPQYTGMSQGDFIDRTNEINDKWNEKTGPLGIIIYGSSSESEKKAAYAKRDVYERARGEELDALYAEYKSQTDAYVKAQDAHRAAYDKRNLTLETQKEALRAKIAELEKQRPINQQLDASQQAYPNLPFMGARVQPVAGQPSFDYDLSKTPFGADYGEVSQVMDGEKLLPQELQDILNRRRGKSPALGGTVTTAEKKKIAAFMITKDAHDLLINDPDTYDRLERALTGRIPPRNLYPGKTPQPQDSYGDFLRGGGMIDPSAYGRVFNTTVPGVKNYNPGYVPYPNPNNYKPVSAGEKAYVRSLQILPGLVNVVSTILGNDEGSAATPADWALQYARGDYTPITKSPGRAFNQNTMELISIALDSPNTPRGSVQTHTYNDRNSFDSIRDTSIRNSLGQFNYRVTANGIEITDTFNFSGNTSIGALAAVTDDIIGKATGGLVDEPIQRNADKLVDIGYRSALEKGQNPADDKHGIPIKYTIPWSEVPAKLQNKLDPNQRLVPIVRRKRGTKTESTTFNKLKKHR